MTSQKILTATVALGLVVALSSCGGDDATNPGDSTGGSATAVTISLAATHARPGTEVDLAGIAAGADLADTYMEVWTTGSKADSPASTAYIGRREDGTPYFITPLHPASIGPGGSVDLSLGGPDFTSAAVTFTVDPLPTVTVTLADYVGRLQTLLTSWLTAYGITRDELRAMDPATMQAIYFPLWHAHEILDSPDNPNSMRAIVDGPVPFFDDEILDFETVERMLSTTDVLQYLDDQVAGVDSLGVFMPGPLDPAKAGSGKMECNIPAGDYGISDAASLELAMISARFGARRIDGASGEVLNDIGNVVSAAGVLPPLKGPATVVSGGMYVFKLVNEASAKLLPTSFDYSATDFNLADDQVDYHEDDIGGFWTKFRITAVSQGWDLDQDALNAILRLAKIKDFGGFTNYTRYGKLQDFAERLTSWAITQGTKLVISEATQGADFFSVCSGRWPNIDVSSTVFSESEIAFGTSFEMTSHTFFETREPGNSELKVKTMDGRFGGVPPTNKSKTINVNAIDVQVAPAVAVLEPLQEMSFTATVTNANDDRVKWIVPAPLIEVRQENFGKTIVVKAPGGTTNWTGPVFLRARSIANTGARKDRVDTDPREGIAAISSPSGSIVVVPDGICVPKNGEETFRALVYGLDDKTVIWTASAGYFVEDLYHAPGTAVDEVTITATSVQNNLVKGTATITVGDCACSWSANVTGEIAGIYDGSFATWTDEFLSYVTLTMDIDGGAPAFSFGPDFVITAPGTYMGLATAIMSEGGPVYGSNEDVTIIIETIDDKVLTGRMSGQLSTPLTQEPWELFIDVDLEFIAQHQTRGGACQ